LALGASAHGGEPELRGARHLRAIVTLMRQGREKEEALMRDDEIGGLDEILGMFCRRAGKDFLSPREAFDEYFGLMNLLIEAADTLSADEKVWMRAAMRELQADSTAFEVFARYYWATAGGVVGEEQ
jgi:hypothetical protein